MRWDAPTQEQIDAAADRIAARHLAEEKRAARLRLTCAALTGIIALEGSHRADLNADRAVENADACLALLYPAPAGREGGNDGR